MNSTNRDKQKNYLTKERLAIQESHYLLASPDNLCALAQLIRAAPFKAGPTGLGPPPFGFFYHKVGPTGLNAQVDFPMCLRSEKAYLETPSGKLQSEMTLPVDNTFTRASFRHEVRMQFTVDARRALSKIGNLEVPEGRP